MHKFCSAALLALSLLAATQQPAAAWDEQFDLGPAFVDPSAGNGWHWSLYVNGPILAPWAEAHRGPPPWCCGQHKVPPPIPPTPHPTVPQMFAPDAPFFWYLN
jgi:hypothetical protein